jgi:hypothetical protein
MADSLAAALVAALAELTVVEKSSEAHAGSYSYSYADIAAVVRHTRPRLAAHGLVALTPVHEHGSGLACTVIVLHESGERLDLGPFPFSHGKDAQATGSMVTYHRRYALLAALGMATGEDDDGATAVARQYTAPPQEDERVPGLRTAVLASIEKLTDPQKDALKEWMAANDLPPVKRMNVAHCEQVIGFLMDLPDGET